MASPDTYVSNTLMVSLSKNAGSFVSWDHPTAPFGGNFFGYWKFWNAGGTAGSKIYSFEAQEAAAAFVEDTGGNIFGTIWGAMWDPESSDTTLDSESDGKIYGILTQGSSGGIGTAINTQGGTTSSISNFTSHSTSNGAAHAGVFTPGAGTLTTLYRESRVSSTTTNLRSTSGHYIRTPLLYSSRASAPNDRFIGRLREVLFGVDGKMGGVYQESAVDVAYVVGGSSTADQDTVWLSR